MEHIWYDSFFGLLLYMWLSIFNTLLLFFFLCLLASVVMKTDIKLLNIKEVMEKEMVRDNISREREVEKQEQSHHGGKPKAASAG